MRAKCLSRQQKTVFGNTKSGVDILEDILGDTIPAEDTVHPSSTITPSWDCQHQKKSPKNSHLRNCRTITLDR